MIKVTRIALSMWGFLAVAGCADGGNAASTYGTAIGGQGGSITVSTDIDATVTGTGTATTSIDEDEED